MPVRRTIRAIFVFLILPISTTSATKAQEKNSFVLTSPAFTNQATIPREFTCDGAGISPPLRWANEPAGTKSFALTVDDPDAPHGDFVHWVVYNIPSTVHEIQADAARAADLGIGAAMGINDTGAVGYKSPCPPLGTHRYIFRLYALDSVLPLLPEITKKGLENAIKGHVRGHADLSGIYARNQTD